MLHTLLALPLVLLPQDPAQAKPAEPKPADSRSAGVPRGLRVRTPKAFDGYTLFAPLRGGTTFLVDMDGAVVHEWKHGLPTMSNDLLDDGHLLYLVRDEDNPVFFGGGIGGRVMELDWDGNVVWDWKLSTEAQITHHMVKPMANGHVLAIVWERHELAEATEMGRDPAAVGKPGWWTDAVFEIEPVRPPPGAPAGSGGAKIVWEWHMSDHLVQDFDRTKKNAGQPAGRFERFDANYDLREKPPMTPEQIAMQKERERALRESGYAGGDDPSDHDDAKPGDAGAKKEEKGDPRKKASEKGDWTHLNSVDYDAKNDLLLLSSPELSEIFVVDHSTTTAQARTSSGGRHGKGGDVLWRWGNPRNWGAGTDADRRLWYQHQPEWIPAGMPGEGHVLVFNNGTGRPGVEHSSIDELDLPFDPSEGFARADNQPFGPKKLAWTYAAPDKASFFSFFISGCRRLPNGNTFVCQGKQGRFFEVTSDGAIAWEFWNPWGGELSARMGKADPHGDRPSPVEPTSVFRATRIAPTHPGLKGRTLTPLATK